MMDNVSDVLKTPKGGKRRRKILENASDDKAGHALHRRRSDTAPAGSARLRHLQHVPAADASVALTAVHAS